jgi:hypothetical protein
MNRKLTKDEKLIVNRINTQNTISMLSLAKSKLERKYNTLYTNKQYIECRKVEDNIQTTIIAINSYKNKLNKLG